MIRKFSILLMAVFFVSCGSRREVAEADTYEFPWYNPGISFEERVSMLIKEMTIEEKISQLTHDAAAIERLGVPEYNWWSEALGMSISSAVFQVN